MAGDEEYPIVKKFARPYDFAAEPETTRPEGWEHLVSPIAILFVAGVATVCLSLSSKEGNIFGLVGFFLGLGLVVWIPWSVVVALNKKAGAVDRVLIPVGAVAAAVVFTFGIIAAIQTGSCGSKGVVFKESGDYVSTRFSDLLYLDKHSGEVLRSQWRDSARVAETETLATSLAADGELTDEDRQQIEDFVCEL